MGINLDDYIDTAVDNTVQPALREKTLDYQNKINQRYAAKEQKNLEQEIKNYYDNKGYTKLLKE
jgi:predicted alpha-1,6-mannanase (GH76 family)